MDYRLAKALWPVLVGVMTVVLVAGSAPASDNTGNSDANIHTTHATEDWTSEEGAIAKDTKKDGYSESTSPRQAMDACKGYQGRSCKKKTTTYSAHSTEYFPKWNRCLVWNFKAKLVWAKHRIPNDPAVTAEDLKIKRPRTKFWVNKWCDKDHPNRKFGGLHAAVKIVASKMPKSTDGGGCDFEPSFSLSVPWSASFSVTPTCSDGTKVAKGRYTGAVSKKRSHYVFGVNNPKRFRIKYDDLYALLPAGPVMCLQTRITGSAEHPRTGKSDAFTDKARDCFNLRRDNS